MIRTLTPEDRARELEAADAQDTRMSVRLLAQALLGCVVCCAIGLGFVVWSVHTTSELAEVAFWSGLLLGDCGSMFVLLRYARSREEYGV